MHGARFKCKINMKRTTENERADESVLSGRNLCFFAILVAILPMSR